MFSFWRSSLSTNYFNLILLLSFLVVFESEAHKMKYCGPKLVRKMFEACETADCNQFGSSVNPDAVMNFEIFYQCCKRSCSHRDVEAFCCGVNPVQNKPSYGRY